MDKGQKGAQGHGKPVRFPKSAAAVRDFLAGNEIGDLRRLERALGLRTYYFNYIVRGEVRLSLANLYKLCRWVGLDELDASILQAYREDDENEGGVKSSRATSSYQNYGAVSAWVLKVRMQAGLSVSELADKLGVKPRLIYEIARFSFDNRNLLFRIAETLGTVVPQDVLDEVDAGVSQCGVKRLIESSTHLTAFGRILRGLRNDRGLTCKMLGEKTGYSGAAISLLERGELNLTIAKAGDLARVFGLESVPEAWVKALKIGCQLAGSAADDALSPLGRELRGLREEKGVSMAALAQKAQVSVSTLHQIEYGLAEVTPDKLYKLAKAFDLREVPEHWKELARKTKPVEVDRTKRKTAIGQKLFEERRSRKMSLKHLSAVTGIHPSTLSQYEHGHRKVGREHLACICKGFGYAAIPQELLAALEGGRNGLQWSQEEGEILNASDLVRRVTKLGPWSERAVVRQFDGKGNASVTSAEFASKGDKWQVKLDFESGQATLRPLQRYVAPLSTEYVVAFKDSAELMQLYESLVTK